MYMKLIAEVFGRLELSVLYNKEVHRPPRLRTTALNNKTTLLLGVNLLKLKPIGSRFVYLLLVPLSNGWLNILWRSTLTEMRRESKHPSELIMEIKSFSVNVIFPLHFALSWTMRVTYNMLVLLLALYTRVNYFYEHNYPSIFSGIAFV